MAFFVAFYSYKGGVGRTLALANAAYLLAARGKRVALLDLDLEAPGLQEYKEFAVRAKSPKGFLEYAAHYRQTGRCPALKGYVHACKESPGTGKLWLMPSGAIGGGYQKQLGDLSWRKLHPQKGTAPFLDGFKKALDDELRPDYVLIDSRTGLSDIGGLTTHQLADMIVLVFNLTRSSLEGSVRTYRSFISKTSKARFLQLVASPVPPLAPSPDSIVERRLAYAREHMPFGVAYGRTILRIDYNPAMALTDELPVRHPENFPAAERYEALREAIQRANPEEVFPVLEQARELRSAGRLEDGLALLQGFVHEHPGNAEGYLELGDFLFEAGRAQEAIPAFRKASELAAALGRGHRRLGEALAATGQTDAAMAALKKAEELGDHSRETYQALARIYSDRRETALETEARREAILSVFRSPSSESTARLSATELQGLRQEFMTVLSHRPPFASFQAEAFWDGVMGSLSLSLRDKLGLLRSVLAGTSKPSEIITILRSLQEESQDLEKWLGPGAHQLQQRLAGEPVDPTDPESLLKLRRGDSVDASLLSYVASLEKPTVRSVELLEEAIQHDPKNAFVFSLLGVQAGLLAASCSAKERLALLERSRTALEEAAQLKTAESREASGLYRDLNNWGSTLVRLADLVERQDRKQLLLEACLKYQEALRHKPDAHEVLFNWGSALVKLSNLAETKERRRLLLRACSKYEAALEHTGEEASTLDAWATALLKLYYVTGPQNQGSLLLKAAEKARRASELQPGVGDYNLACALSLQGEHDEASRLITAALERRPDLHSSTLQDPDLAPLWEARPDLRASIAASLPPVPSPTPTDS